MSLVSVDFERCDALAKSLAGFSLPPDSDNEVPRGLDRETTKDAYLVLAAICHQTTPLGGVPLLGESEGRNLRGWDYLKGRMVTAIREDSSLISVPRLASFQGSELIKIMDDGKGGGQITDPEGRASLLRDIGTVMGVQGWENAEAIFQASGNRLRGEGGMYQQLAKMRAFNDPLEKKSHFYLGVMQNSGIWEFDDKEELGSAIDYHVTRGTLRSGAVVVQDMELKQKLETMEEVGVEVDLEIRQAVGVAIDHIAGQLRLSRNAAHHLFWNVFRNCCNRENPHCNGCTNCKLPGRYKTQALDRCMFASSCQQNISLLEHNFAKTDWY